MRDERRECLMSRTDWTAVSSWRWRKNNNVTHDSFKLIIDCRHRRSMIDGPIEDDKWDNNDLCSFLVSSRGIQSIIGVLMVGLACLTLLYRCLFNRLSQCNSRTRYVLSLNVRNVLFSLFLPMFFEDEKKHLVRWFSSDYLILTYQAIRGNWNFMISN